MHVLAQSLEKVHFLTMFPGGGVSPPRNRLIRLLRLDYASVRHSERVAVSMCGGWLNIHLGLWWIRTLSKALFSEDGGKRARHPSSRWVPTCS